MSRKAIQSPDIKAVGPYSHAVDAGGLIFLSGQIPVEPETGKLVPGGVGAQTEQCLKNALSVLAAAGLDESHVQKVTVFLTDMADFAAMNEVYKTRFSEPYPARSAIAVAGLPLGAMVEIETIAKK